MLSRLLFADDTALVDDSAKQLQGLVRELALVCEGRNLRVNIDESKVLVLEQIWDQRIVEFES